MIKKTTLILYLLLNCFFYANCLAPSLNNPEVIIQEATDQSSFSENDSDSDNEEQEYQEPEEVPAGNMATLLQMLQEGRNTHLILNNPTIANQVIQQNLQQPLPDEPNPILETLTEVKQTLAANAGSAFGHKAVEVLTTNCPIDKINSCTLNNEKLAYKLKELETTNTLINAKRAPAQKVIFDALKKELLANSSNNTEEINEENINESHKFLLELISSQKALQEATLDILKKELSAKSSNNTEDVERENINEFHNFLLQLISSQKALQESTFDVLKKELSTKSINNTERVEEGDESESQDFLLQLISSQKAIQETPLTKEEISELSSNCTSVLNHINKTLQAY